MRFGGDFMYVILVYDIASCDNGNKVWKKVFCICKKYLTHIQNSVFEGEISKVQLKQLEYEINQYLRDDKDSVIIFKSRTQKWLDKEMWGMQDDATSPFL